MEGDVLHFKKNMTTKLSLIKSTLPSFKPANTEGLAAQSIIQSTGDIDSIVCFDDMSPLMNVHSLFASNAKLVSLPFLLKLSIPIN